jgi:dihydropteroate synthase
MTINCKGRLIDLSSPKVMGILNITPDSFYDGGRLNSEREILAHVETMLNEGAFFIDIGAYSSRPGATHIDEDEELQRILPVIQMILKRFPEALLSIDTFRANVAERCVHAGACMINDISAGNLDPHMMQTISALGVPYIMMHMKGTPQNMRHQTDYSDLLKDILFYFSQKIASARQLQVVDLIIDPGFGFAKTLEQNYKLLTNLNLFQTLDLPILVGLSRKSMIYKALETSAKEALIGTVSLNTVALQKGANILRVHDVKQAVESVKLMQMLDPKS